jgi:hypothetical protein
MRVRTPSSMTVTPLQRTDVPNVLERDFGLAGFTLGAEGRIVRDVA